MSVKKSKVDDDSDDLTRDLEDPVSEINISEISLNMSQVKTGKFKIINIFFSYSIKILFIF